MVCFKNASGETRRQSKKLQESIKTAVDETKIDKLDKMLSDLVIYCQCVPFDMEGI